MNPDVLVITDIDRGRYSSAEAFINAMEAIQDAQSMKHASIGQGRIVGWDNGKAQKQQGRNEPCQCGSGKKFKKCCLINARSSAGGVSDD